MISLKYPEDARLLREADGLLSRVSVRCDEIATARESLRYALNRLESVTSKPHPTEGGIVASMGERYFLSKDSSCHEYLVPLSKRADWVAFLRIPEDDERSWEVPEFARRVDGGIVTFTDPVIE